MGRVKEIIGNRAVRYGGTPLDHKIRAATNDARTAKRVLENLRAGLEETVGTLEAELARAEDLYVACTQRLVKLKERKASEEPGTVTPMPVRRRRKPWIEAGLTKEQWVELRKRGEHLEILQKYHAGEL